MSNEGLNKKLSLPDLPRESAGDLLAAGVILRNLNLLQADFNELILIRVAQILY